MLCFAVSNVLLEDMFFLKVCIIGGYVLQFEMSYTLLEVCFVGCHVFQNFVPSSCSPKAAVPPVIYIHLLCLSSTNFILLLELLIGFFLVNLAGNVKIY